MAKTNELTEQIRELAAREQGVAISELGWSAQTTRDRVYDMFIRGELVRVAKQVNRTGPGRRVVWVYFTKGNPATPAADPVLAARTAAPRAPAAKPVGVGRAYALARAFENEGPSPCIMYSCPKRSHCAEDLLACHAFAAYVESGQMTRPTLSQRAEYGARGFPIVGSHGARPEPTRAIYLSIYNDREEA